MEKTEENKKESRAVSPKGPFSRNPYFNFLFEFRRGHPELKPKEVVEQGAAAWQKLSIDKRNKYVEQAFYAPKYAKQDRNGSSTDVSDSELSMLSGSGSSNSSTCSSTQGFSN